MADNLSDEQIAAYEEAFNFFDKNGDGHISFEELKLVFKQLNVPITPEMLQAGIKAVDGDGDGNLDLEEFIDMMEMKVALYGRQDPDQELRAAFKIFDKDNDGRISAKEIHRVMLQFGQKITWDEISMMIAEADVDGDAEIDFEEFKALMRK